MYRRLRMTQAITPRARIQRCYRRRRRCVLPDQRSLRERFRGIALREVRMPGYGPFPIETVNSDRDGRAQPGSEGSTRTQ